MTGRPVPATKVNLTELLENSAIGPLQIQVFVLCMLGPVVSFPYSSEERPGMLVLIDTSKSMGLKDSSGLLPGHGGVLDRVDALLPTLPLAMMLASFASR